MRLVLALVLTGVTMSTAAVPAAYGAGPRSSAAENVATDDLGREDRLVAFAMNGFEPGLPGLRVNGGIPSSSITARFGQPLRTIIKQEPDRREPGAINEIVVQEYEGLVITSSRGSSPGNAWLQSIVLTSSDYPLKHGLRIGQPRSTFVRQLGKPYETRGGKLLYHAEDFAQAAHAALHGNVTVTIETGPDDRVVKATWEHDAD